MKTVYQINQFITRWGLRTEQILGQAAGKYSLPQDLFSIRRQALDVRGKRPRAVHTLEVPANRETARLKNRPEVREIEIRTLADEMKDMASRPGFRPLIVGMGPAGLFAAMVFAEAGCPAVILERGKPVEERAVDVEHLWTNDILDTESNPLFGEGGAGTFSDGKLNTRINDPLERYVLEHLAAFGARDRILTDAKPHIGTDRLIKVMQESRRWLLDHGTEIRFNSRVVNFSETSDGITLETADGDSVSGSVALLATGHSARDTYRMLRGKNMDLEPKPFAVGVRMEHPQERIDDLMYGKGNRNRYGLPPATYQFSWNGPDGTGCYTFCMCPGGEVILTVNEDETLCVNGMSNSKRNSPFANAALVGKVPVTAYRKDDPLDGIAYQLELEQRFFRMGVPGCMAPAQPAPDFLKRGMPQDTLATSYRNTTYAYPLHELLPEPIVNQLHAGLEHFNDKVGGFVDRNTNLIGVETRSSAPVRILRDRDTRRSVSHPLIAPCGEGAGYAGGIMSAALDGMHTALAILKNS